MKHLLVEIFEVSNTGLGEGYIVSFDRPRGSPIKPEELSERLHTPKEVADKIIRKLVIDKLKGNR